MSHLRRKLEVGGEAPGTITSVPAVGYVFRRAALPEAPTAALAAVAPGAVLQQADSAA
jgi:hypothetical protein